MSEKPDTADEFIPDAVVNLTLSGLEDWELAALGIQAGINGNTTADSLKRQPWFDKVKSLFTDGNLHGVVIEAINRESNRRLEARRNA